MYKTNFRFKQYLRKERKNNYQQKMLQTSISNGKSSLKYF